MSELCDHFLKQSMSGGCSDIFQVIILTKPDHDYQQVRHIIKLIIDLYCTLCIPKTVYYLAVLDIFITYPDYGNTENT